MGDPSVRGARIGAAGSRSLRVGRADLLPLRPMHHRSTGRAKGAPRWPGGRRFAFTIFDDTDGMTLENGPPVYDLLDRLDMRITKSVWPTAAPAWRPTSGSTCADGDYLTWVLALQAQGHEIGYHNATDGSSTREQTRAALDRFRPSGLGICHHPYIPLPPPILSNPDLPFVTTQPFSSSRRV